MAAFIFITDRHSEAGVCMHVHDLRGENERQRQEQKLLSLAGSLSQQDAAELRESARSLRENWR